MRTTQEREECLQCQEKAWTKYKQIRKAQEESEERKKQYEIDVCTNKEQ